jgi:hypothetical protein
MSAGGYIYCTLNWLKRNSVWLWPASLFAAALMYTLFIVKPFSPAVPISNVISVAGSWSSNVSQLGISPLYPPQENFFVGDLWAIVTKSPEESMLGRGARVGHVDLSNAIKADFSSKIEIDKIFSQEEKSRESKTKTDSSIRMFALAFPGVTISHSGVDGGFSSLSVLSFGASRKSDRLDEIKISSAETYGADLVQSIVSLYAFCADKDTGIRCTNDFIRNILSAVLDEKIGNNSPTKNEYEIRLQLITKVYVTKGITHRRRVNGSVSIETIGASADQNSGASSANKPVISHQGGDTSDIIFDEKFEKPLVFGFRSAIFEPR